MFIKAVPSWYLFIYENLLKFRHDTRPREEALRVI